MTEATDKMLADLREARATMIEAIEVLVQRGARLDDLTSRASELSESTAHLTGRIYARTSNRRTKLFVGVALAVVLTLFGIYSFAFF